MITVFEPVCTNGEHAPFNAAMLLSARHISDDGRVAFFGEAAHIQRVAECLPLNVASEFKMHSLSVAERHLRAFVPRLLKEFPLLAKVWQSTRKTDSEMLIITGVTEPGLFAIKLLFLYHKPSIPVIVIFHGILPRFLYSAKRRLFLRAFVPKNVKYVVLGSHILFELEKISPSVRSKIESITHPYVFQDADSPRRSVSVDSKFAFAGLASKGKGFPEFLHLIHSTNPHCSVGKGPRFYLVGSVSDECKEIFQSFKVSDASWNLWYPLQPGPLPMDLYHKKIAEVDYLIMMHSSEAYKLVTSGSALDALLLLKPLVALRSPFFETFFEKAGDVGYLCDDLEDLSETVLALIHEPPTERYQRQVENLFKARLLFAPAVVAEELLALTKDPV